MDKQVQNAVKEAGNGTKTDHLLEMAIMQGYVPKTCTLNGGLVMALMNSGEDPCSGCNMDRIKCGGRAKR